MFSLAVIPARGGSRGLPRKNLLTAAGRPLLCYTLDYLVGESLVSDTVLSTEDREIAALASSCGVKVLLRPPELAEDHVVSTEAVRHAVQQYESLFRKTVDAVVELYITCPIRPPGLVDRGIKEMMDQGATGAMSVARVGIRHPSNMKTIDAKGRLCHPFGYSASARQTCQPLYYLSGAAFFVRRDVLVGTPIDRNNPNANYLFGDDVLGVEHEPGEVVDIDEEIDLLFADFLLRRRLSSTT